MFVELTKAQRRNHVNADRQRNVSDDSSDGIELERVYSMWQHDYFENHFTSWADWDRHHSER